MAISRAQLAKELEPGLNALFGLEYSRYENEHAEMYTEESRDRGFESNWAHLLSFPNFLHKTIERPESGPSRRCIFYQSPNKNGVL